MRESGLPPPQGPAKGKLPDSQRQQEGVRAPLSTSRLVYRASERGPGGHPSSPQLCHLHLSTPLPSPAPISGPVTLKVKGVRHLLLSASLQGRLPFLWPHLDLYLPWSQGCSCSRLYST